METPRITVEKIYNCIDAVAPFENCETWDNSGLLAGSMQTEVTGIMCALDLSRNVILEAGTKNCNLIVTHHPILFSARKNVREDDEEGKMICELIRRQISLIAAHTNFDRADGGVNDTLAAILGLKNTSRIEDDEEGYLRIGEVTETTLANFAHFTREQLGDAVRVYGNASSKIRRVAVCGGSGGEFAHLAKAAGAQAYVTGEMRYHDSLELAQEGFATLQCGHDATERPAVSALKQLIEKELLWKSISLPLYVSQMDRFGVTL